MSADAEYDARIAAAVKAAGRGNIGPWVWGHEVAREFGVPPRTMGSRLHSAERRGIVESIRSVDGAKLWRVRES